MVRQWLYFFCLASLAASAGMVKTPVFIGGEEGYACYRIPAIIMAPSGDLLAFAEGRKDDCGDHGDIDLVMRRSTDRGGSWGALQVVYEEGDTQKVTIGNPCPVVDRDTNTIWMPFCRDNTDVFMTKSLDDGATWAAPVEITDSVKRKGWTWYATGPGVGIQLHQGSHAGRLLIPCDHREPVDGKKMEMSHCFYSDDQGTTWQLGESVGLHTDECQAVELADGRVLINMRNYWARSGDQPDKGGMRVTAWSGDGGATWSELAFDEELPSPVCQASITRLGADGGGDALLLFSNPAHTKRRIQMTVRMSPDGGGTWPVARELFAGPAAYSCLVALGKDEAGCLYERGLKNPYQQIVFARFSRDWLETSP